MVFASESATAVIVNWCVEPNQPLEIISGLEETFVKRYIVERTNKAEIRPEEQSQKTELVGILIPVNHYGVYQG